jgi:hypothetical protein
MLRLPHSLRGAFKEPFGPVYADAESLLAAVDERRSGTLIAVGDVVTAHLVRAGRTPDVAVVDGRTEREAVSTATAEALEPLPPGTAVTNPAGEISEALLRALVEAVDVAEPEAQPRVIDVDGEEDLATLPAVVTAPEGTAVVYGQPQEGMVLVEVTPETRAAMVDLLDQFEGDVDAALAVLTGTHCSRRENGDSVAEDGDQ